jgi:hypothetical protein
MAGYRATQIRRPANETEFEKNCVVLFREILDDPSVKRLEARLAEASLDRILGAISLRDERLVPALARARAIAQARIGRR